MTADKQYPERFPVMQVRGRYDGAPTSVPWSLVAPHEAHAQANHSQSLRVLARRGGLSPGELWIVIHGLRWGVAMPLDHVVVEELVRLVSDHEGGNDETP